MVVSAALVAACSGGGDGGSGATLDGAIVKGPVTGSSVCAFQLVGGAKGPKLNLQATAPGGVIANGCFVTGADGSYAFTVPGFTGEVLIEASGGMFCSDENPLTAGGACTAGGVPVGLNEPMTAAASVTSGSRSTTYVTPLTTAAVNTAAAGGGISVESFRGRFATLAGSVLGNSAITPSAVPTVASQPFLATVAQQMRAGGTLSAAVTGLQHSSGSPSTPGSTTTTTSSPATVAAALAGSYSLVFDAGGATGTCGTSCSFVNGQTYQAQVTGNQLVIGSLSLSNPVYRAYGGVTNLHEVIWIDTANGIEYALSDNASPAHFNEINVARVAATAGAAPTFLGQLKKPLPAATQTLLAMGEGPFSRSFQYSGSPASWNQVTLSGDGSVRLGSTTLISAAQVSAITAYPGRVDITANIDINNHGGVSGEDVVRLYHDANNNLTAVEYYTGDPSSSNNQVGVAVGTHNPAFPTHDGTFVPTAGNNVLRATLNGTALDLPVTPVTLQGGATGLTINASNGTNQHFQISVSGTGALVAGNTYECIPNRTSMSATVGSAFYRVSTGGRCRVEILQVESTFVTGRFVAQLVVGDPRVAHPIANGVFRIQTGNPG